jgi:pimeloyl-ACP methyl ester carboxylesterase
MNLDPPLIDHEDWTDEQDSLEIAVDGHDVSIAYRDAGPTNAHPVVFIHGIPTWSFLWRRITPAFEENFRTVVPDLLGYGNSDRRDEFDRSIRAQEVVVGELIENLDLDTVTLVAHDIG